MRRKVCCMNTGCKHHRSDNECSVDAQIGESGKCVAFEKGFAYYFHLVWSALGKGNFIDMHRCTRDLRIGIYYVLACYGLGFSEEEWGTWRFLQFKDGNDGKPLKYKDIIAREINMDVFTRLYSDFLAGNLPGSHSVGVSQETHEKADLGFGWLSPSGEFTESPFGSHEESAEQICTQQNWCDEYFTWRHTQSDRLCLFRDFLTSVKGYCLIHNPSGDGGYIVTHRDDLTRKQRDFLYGYFYDKGDRFKAERFLDGEHI